MGVSTFCSESPKGSVGLDHRCAGRSWAFFELDRFIRQWPNRIAGLGCLSWVSDPESSKFAKKGRVIFLTPMHVQCSDLLLGHHGIMADCPHLFTRYP